ncbi:MAG TPA: protein translocase subunit SecD, partial [Catenuloplanes sp.]
MAPPQGQMRPGRQLAVLGLIFVVLYLFVFFAGAKGGLKERLEPRLGLDLVGGTRVTLEALTPNGQAPPPANLEEARRIIQSRVDALGVAEAEVVIEGDRNIVVSKAGQGADALKEVGAAAQLRFRKVLKATNDTGGATPPDPSASASGAADPGAPGAEAVPGAPKPSGQAGGQGGGAPAPTPSGSASPAPSASPSAAAGRASAALTPEQRLAEARKKVGEPAWAAATALQAPATDPAQAAALAPFGKLSPQEVAALPPAIQFNVPSITCEQLDNRVPGSIVDQNQPAVACEPGAKYLLDKAKVLGTDVAKAAGVLDQTNAKWVVSLDFTNPGQGKWTALTKEAFNNEGNGCDESAVGPDKHCRVAVVLDNTVVSAPEIQGVLTGQSQITGNFDGKSAGLLANQLNYGALPLTFNPQEAQTISATLGTEQLRAGLQAAGVGMLLVAIYAFFYYRLLGSVIFLSLILSALLTYGALVVLGRQIGFTLTLAGIAGFIVSLGVAADSFVIYFERL